MNAPPTQRDILSWLREEDPARLAGLWRAADATRRARVGDAVHLRGLIEISNHCVRQCLYCGLRAGHSLLPRYRMEAGEILAAARQAVAFGYGTVVLQGGEDYALTREWVAAVVRQIKTETPLAVTLSLGERPDADLEDWRRAGADRYLLRFETSDSALFEVIHPGLGSRPSDRIGILRRLKALGYETGSGIMVGLPGQSYASVARDIALFGELDLDMVGIGPFIPHPRTPLGSGQTRSATVNGEQVPAVELMVYKAVALTRLVCPEANIPSTTALATINQRDGRESGLRRGANVVMPNLTPVKYRRLYEIYPGKACVTETAEACQQTVEIIPRVREAACVLECGTPVPLSLPPGGTKSARGLAHSKTQAPFAALGDSTDCQGSLRQRIAALGRHVGVGPGGRKPVPTPLPDLL